MDDGVDGAQAVVNNHRTERHLVARQLVPEMNLASDEELGDHGLSETVPIQDVPRPGQRGVKRKISALVPSKETSTERKHFFH